MAEILRKKGETDGVYGVLEGGVVVSKQGSEKNPHHFDRRKLINFGITVSLLMDVMDGVGNVIYPYFVFSSNNFQKPASTAPVPADVIEASKYLNDKNSFYNRGDQIVKPVERVDSISRVANQNMQGISTVSQEGNTEEREFIDLTSYSSSDARLDRSQQKIINREAESSFEFANTTLRECFPADLESFSVVGVTPVKLGKNGEVQILINLVGKDSSGIFSFNLLKLDGKYYPLFNLSEFPPMLKETPIRMPVFLVPNKQTNESYEDMWENAAFQVTRGAGRVAHLDMSPGNPSRSYSMATWLMDFYGNGLPDLIFDGEEFDGVTGGFLDGTLPTSSADFDPTEQRFTKAPSFEDPFYIKRDGRYLFALNKDGTRLMSATIDSKTGKWTWKEIK